MRKRILKQTQSLVPVPCCCGVGRFVEVDSGRDSVVTAHDEEDSNPNDAIEEDA